MTDAFYNGFPITYSDTSTYIASGFELETPFDRPITYGLFIRFFSLNGLSLWFVVFFQALMLSYLIFQIIRLLTEEKSYLKFGLLTIILLSLFTSASWTVSQIMPDIFTSIALLSAILILLGRFKRSTMTLLYVVFFISVAMHISHILLFGLILISCFSLRKFILPIEVHSKSPVRIATLALLTVMSIITMGSAISKSKHVFLMGAMVEHGIVKNYLYDHCSTEQYKLCIYKDSLPDRAYKFIWDEKSPFYKIGGWKETKNEFNNIILGTLTEPKFLRMHIIESLKATLEQLSRFMIGDGNGSFMEGTLLHKRVSKYFSNDLTFYSESRQNKSHLNFINWLNPLFSAILILSILLTLFFFVAYKNIITDYFRSVALILVFGILLNAWDCGTFANAIDRLGCKMIWLIPFLAIVVVLKNFQTRNNTNEKA